MTASSAPAAASSARAEGISAASSDAASRSETSAVSWLTPTTQGCTARSDSVRPRDFRDGGQAALVLALPHHPLDPLLDLRRGLARQEETVQVRVGDPQLLLVGLPLPKACGRSLLDDAGRDPQLPGERPDLSLYQVPDGKQVHAVVRELGKVAHGQLRAVGGA